MSCKFIKLRGESGVEASTVFLLKGAAASGQRVEHFVSEERVHASHVGIDSQSVHLNCLRFFRSFSQLP